MSNINSKLPEELKFLKELIKKGADKLGLLNNPNLEDYLMSDEFGERYDIFVNNLLIPLLIEINNPQRFDEIFQGFFNKPDLIFYQELEKLIKFAYKKDESKAMKLVSKFLKIPAIDFFKKSHSRKLISSFEMTKNIIGLSKEFKNKDFDIHKSIEFMLNILLNVNKETKKMLKIPRILKSEVENVINLIKNHYESMRYIVGLILGLFDIVEDNLNRNILWYFSPNKSPTFYYYPPKGHHIHRLRLKNYLNLSKYSESFCSVRYMLEEWIFKIFKDIRIHKAHREIDIIQDELYEGLYKIDIGGVSYKYTLEEIYEIESQAFKFILWVKSIVAKQYYQNDQDLVNYLIRKMV